MDMQYAHRFIIEPVGDAERALEALPEQLAARAHAGLDGRGPLAVCELLARDGGEMVGELRDAPVGRFIVCAVIRQGLGQECEEAAGGRGGDELRDLARAVEEREKHVGGERRERRGLPFGWKSGRLRQRRGRGGGGRVLGELDELLRAELLACRGREGRVRVRPLLAGRALHRHLAAGRVDGREGRERKAQSATRCGRGAAGRPACAAAPARPSRRRAGRGRRRLARLRRHAHDRQSARHRPLRLRLHVQRVRVWRAHRPSPRR